jgi:predicted RNA-binding Zn ribbon-like protein
MVIIFDMEKTSLSPRAPALFVGDAPGLDFLNSVATPADTPQDWVADGDGLLAWLEQSRLVPRDVLLEMREQAVPGELDSIAARARDLREWFRGFVQAHKGHALEASAVDELAPLNGLLERDEAYQVVAGRPGHTGLQLQATRRWKSPESLLLPIGVALARLVTDEDFAFVKACEGPACTLLFADHTRARNRRWCSMDICGNRAKQAAHRQRAKMRH